MDKIFELLEAIIEAEGSSLEACRVYREMSDDPIFETELGKQFLKNFAKAQKGMTLAELSMVQIMLEEKFKELQEEKP